MPERKMPKRTALILVSLLFTVIYTISVTMLVILNKTNSSLLSGNASFNNSTSSVISSVYVDSGSSQYESINPDASSKTDTSDVLSSDNSYDEQQNTNQDTEAENNNSVSSSKPNTSYPDGSIPTVTPSKVNFSTAIWISVFDMKDTGLEGMTKAEFKSMISEMFNNCVYLGIETVFCQVRPYGDALYKSSYFPYSELLTGTEGKNPGYDPLEIIVNEAHLRKLKIHAWINPYRISTKSNDISKLALADSNPAKKWLTDNDTDNDRYVRPYKNGLYYNPAILDVQKLIINGIREICENYDVDGIHIDDYFYPDGVDEEFDSVEYTNSGKILSLADWRRANVNALVTGMYSVVKSYGLTFGISPAGNIDKNYNELYADIEKWISTPGYTDYIIPQIYFGYNYPNNQFAYLNLLSDWMKLKRLSNVKIYIGLANYKIDNSETFKGVTNNEWITDSDTISKQTKDAYNKKTDGVVLFSYGSVFGNSKNQITQTNNFKETIKSIKD